jgi:hypothetical protein
MNWKFWQNKPKPPLVPRLYEVGKATITVLDEGGLKTERMTKGYVKRIKGQVDPLVVKAEHRIQDWFEEWTRIGVVSTVADRDGQDAIVLTPMARVRRIEILYEKFEVTWPRVPDHEPVSQ